MDEYGIDELYNGVVNDVINQVRPIFLDDGVDIEILRHLKKSQTGSDFSQLDGGGPTMTDSSSEEEEELESTENKKSVKEEVKSCSDDEEEPPLNSDDDGDDENVETVFETDNIVRTRKLWKFHLKEGIMNIYGHEFCFRRCNGEAEW